MAHRPAGRGAAQKLFDVGPVLLAEHASRQRHHIALFFADLLQVARGAQRQRQLPL